jgi:hypothetical protein
VDRLQAAHGNAYVLKARPAQRRHTTVCARPLPLIHWSPRTARSNTLQDRLSLRASTRHRPGGAAATEIIHDRMLTLCIR